MSRGIQAVCLFGLSAAIFLSPAIAYAATPVLQAKSDTYDVKKDEFASAIVIDVATGKVLYSYQPNKAWPAASLTKLMGALVTVDQKPNWNQIISLSAKDEVGGGRLRVKTGARMSIRDLLYSSVLASANNAAMALARVTGLSSSAFMKKMNAKAKALGMTHTTFVDPSGIEPGNVTTVTDLSKLALAAFADPIIKGPAGSTHYTFTIRNTGEKKTLTNTNHLLTLDPAIYVYGGKTGFLYESMYNVATVVQPISQNPASPKLLVIVFGAPTENAVFASAKALANWTWGAYRWK